MVVLPILRYRNLVSPRHRFYSMVLYYLILWEHKKTEGYWQLGNLFEGLLFIKRFIRPYVIIH